MNWNRIARLFEALDKRITENVAYRGEMWVHDPEADPHDRGPGAGKAVRQGTSRPAAAAAAPLRRHGMA